MEKRNIIVGQSGGPTAVINSSLYGVLAEGLTHAAQIGVVYGMVNGIQGFLEDKYMDLGQVLQSREKEALTYTPGAYLGSCRYKLPEDLTNPVYGQLFQKLEELQIGYFFYIGGNDSMDTVSKLSRYAEQVNSPIRFIGIPKTIDNDLVLTDHTPGFGSAARYVATVVREIVTDAEVYDTKSVTIVEIMGRHAGWLTAASVLARRFKGDNPVLVYLPEVAFDLEAFLQNVTTALDKRKNLVVCVSEGIHDGKGKFICEYDTAVGTDTFGHKMLSGSGKFLENLIRQRLGVKVRSVELNVAQRCSSGHISRTDRDEAILAGRFGVQAALQKKTGKMVAFQREDGPDYRISCSLKDVNAVCNQEKKVPRDWILDGCDMSEAFVAYGAPLIQGAVTDHLDEGDLPAFVYRENSRKD